MQVRYDVRRGFFVQGLFEVEIRGLHDIMAVVDEGNGNRRVSSHLLNKDSSRSHSLLTVYLDSERKDPEDGHLVKQFGKLSQAAAPLTQRVVVLCDTCPYEEGLFVVLHKTVLADKTSNRVEGRGGSRLPISCIGG